MSYSVVSGAGLLLTLPRLYPSRTTDDGIVKATDDTITPLDNSITAAVAFLESQYKPDTGLLREAPQYAPNRYWLVNDNAVAMLALRKVGRDDLADQVLGTLQSYESVLRANGRLILDSDNVPTNTPLAILWGKQLSEWPPRSYVYSRLAEDLWYDFDINSLCYGFSCPFEIVYEHWDGSGRFYDWEEYANLAALGALNEQYVGRPDIARQVFATLMSKFDDYGFPDKAYDIKHEYETFKLALALYVGLRLNAFCPALRDEIANGLLAKQHGADSSVQAGGFHSHYTRTETRGDVNTETTSLVILALNQYQKDLGLTRSCMYLPMINR